MTSRSLFQRDKNDDNEQKNTKTTILPSGYLAAPLTPTTVTPNPFQTNFHPGTPPKSNQQCFSAHLNLGKSRTTISFGARDDALDVPQFLEGITPNQSTPSKTSTEPSNPTNIEFSQQNPASVKLPKSVQEIGLQIPFSEIKFGRKLGGGTYGTVFLAEWNGSTYAAKKFQDHVSREKILMEAGALAVLKHEHIVPLIGVTVATDTNEIILLMEHMQDGSVEDFLMHDNGQFSLTEVIQIALDVSTGLHYLHSQKIIHRDLKGENILLYGGKKRAKLSDFGTVRIFGQSSKTNSLTGTMSFMAPEVIHRNDYNAKADVYSFGALLYRMLTKKYFPILFEDDEAAKKMIEIAVDHSAMRDLITKCAKKNPNERPTIEYCIESLNAMRQFSSQVTNSESEPASTQQMKFQFLDATIDMLNAELIFEKHFQVALNEYNKCGANLLEFAVSAAKANIKSFKGIVLAFLVCSQDEKYQLLMDIAPIVLNSVYNEPIENGLKSLFEAIKLYSDQNMQQAKQVMNRLVQSYQFNAWLLYLHAWIISESNSNMSDEVINITNNILAIDSTFYLALHLQSHVLWRAGRKNDALKATDALIELNDQFAPAWYDKAKWSEDFDTCQVSFHAYDKVLEINSRYKPAIVGKVRLLMKSNLPISEVASLMASIGDLSDYVEYYGEYIQYLENRGDNKELLAALKNGPAAIVRTPEMLYKKAKILFEEHRYHAAVKTIDKAIASDPQNKEFLNFKAKVKEMHDHYESTLNAFDRILTSSKNNKHVLLLKLNLVETRGDDEEVLAVLDKLITLDPLNEEYLLKKVAACKNTGRYALCYETATIMTQIDPHFGTYWALLAIFASQN